MHILTVLPNPPVQVMKETKEIFYKYLLNGKPDKIKRNVIMNNYEEGGLNLPHIESFCKAVKMSLFQKLLDPINMSPSIILLLSYIGKYGGDKILYLKKEGLARIFEKLNPFWRDVLLNLSERLPIKDEQEKYIINILSQPFWFNFNIKRNGIFFIIEKYYYNGVFLLMILFLKINSFFVISGISRQLYDKYKLSRILWYCGGSPNEMEKPYFRVWEAA